MFYMVVESVNVVVGPLVVFALSLPQSWGTLVHYFEPDQVQVGSGPVNLDIVVPCFLIQQTNRFCPQFYDGSDAGDEIPPTADGAECRGYHP